MLFALRSQSSSFFVTIIIFNYLSLFKITCSHSICLGIDSVFFSFFGCVVYVFVYAHMYLHVCACVYISSWYLITTPITPYLLSQGRVSC